MEWRWRAAILLTALCGPFFWGCATTASQNGALPEIDCSSGIETAAAAHPSRTVSLLPVDVEIAELGSGGSPEEVPQWTEAGRTLVTRCLNDVFTKKQGTATVAFNGLTKEGEELLNQVRALHDVIVFSKQWTRTIPAWDHLADKQYTLGTALSGLKEEIGADAILFLSGRDYHSSAGRKAAFVVYAALTGGGVLPMGYCYLQAGLVDLETGNILWTNAYGDGVSSLKDEAQVQLMMDTLFAEFPFIEEDDAKHVDRK